MIKADQPTIFDTSVIAAVSSIVDGNMKFGVGETKDVVQNRRRFLQEAGIDIADTTRVAVTYDTDDFTKYRVVRSEDKGDGMHDADSLAHADALVVDMPNHALFLPIADCVGVIIHDPIHQILMVSHVGRHSAEMIGATKSVTYLEEHYDTRPQDLLVWLSPAVGSDTYPLHKFEGKGLHEVIVAQLLGGGVLGDHIEVSNVDTATNEAYFSHSEFIKGKRQQSGRFAVVAMMSEQGEPAS